MAIPEGRGVMETLVALLLADIEQAQLLCFLFLLAGRVSEMP